MSAWLDQVHTQTPKERGGLTEHVKFATANVIRMTRRICPAVHRKKKAPRKVNEESLMNECPL